jgi:WD40 repeat protein
MDNLFTSSTRLRFTQVGVLHGHTGEVLLVSFAPDGLQLASFSKPDTLCLWDVIQQRIVRVLSETGEVIAIAFSYDGRYLAAAYSNGSVQLWALQGEPVGELQVHQYGVAGLAFLPEHHILVTLDGSGLIRWSSPKISVNILSGRLVNTRV